MSFTSVKTEYPIGRAILSGQDPGKVLGDYEFLADAAHWANEAFKLDGEPRVIFETHQGKFIRIVHILDQVL